MYRPHLQREGVSPIVELFTPLPRIQADRDALEEALINLIDNAVKYGGDEKYLRIGTGFEGGKVFVEVADHGIGIPPR